MPCAKCDIAFADSNRIRAFLFFKLVVRLIFERENSLMHYKKQPLSFSEVLTKLMRFCAYQERSTWEVETKLKTYGLPAAEGDKVVDLLINDNFLSDQRFAEAFVKGKVNAKRWGRYKIIQGLSAKGIRGEIANSALEGIDSTIYKENLIYLRDRKLEQLIGKEKLKEKVYRYLLSKGYESALIAEQLAEIPN